MMGHLIHGKRTKPEEMTQLHESLRSEMVAAQLRQKEYYHLHRKPDPNLQSGDMVWLFISKNNPWRLVRPLRLAHLAHITSTANQDATT